MTVGLCTAATDLQRRASAQASLVIFTVYLPCPCSSPLTLCLLINLFNCQPIHLMKHLPPSNRLLLSSSTRHPPLSPPVSSCVLVIHQPLAPYLPSACFTICVHPTPPSWLSADNVWVKSMAINTSECFCSAV